MTSTLQIVLVSFICGVAMGAVVPTASISSHVLDTVPGNPAAGVALIAYILQNDEWKQIGATFTGQDGRVPWVSPNFTLIKGTYKLWFGIGDYYTSQNTESFYPYAEVVFKVNDATRHYHVPLTLSPYAYSTYRGS